MIAGMDKISRESPLFFAILLQHVSILKRNAKLRQMIEKTTIKFEDMPRAQADLIEKVEELNCKLESLNETSVPRQAEWMGARNYAPISPHTRRCGAYRVWLDKRTHDTFPQEG